MSVDSRSRLTFVCVLSMLAFRASGATPVPPSIGIFAADQDVGTVLHPGSARYDPAGQTYTVSGSGENMWFGEDDFHFAWKKISDAHDLALTADVAFVGKNGNEHRKAVLMIRQTLDANSPFVDDERQKSSCARDAFWWPGNDQRAFLVSRQPEAGICQLRIPAGK